MLCALDTDIDLDVALARREQQVAKGTTAPPVEGRNESIITALVLKNPRLKSFTDSKHTELNEGEGGTGIQVSLYTDEIDLSIPYWYSGTAARTAFQEAWAYLRIIQPLCGYAIYDPQKGELIDLETDFEMVLAIYDGVVHRFGSQPGASGAR